MASIKILLRNKANKRGQYPVVLKIIKNRKIKIISLGLFCDLTDWNEKENQFKKSHPNYIQRNRILLLKKEKALKIIDEFNLECVDFTLQQFESKFRGKKTEQVSVKAFWREKVDDLNRSGRTGNARAYRDTMNSFFKFYRKDTLRFEDIDVQLLDKYETFLRGKGNKDGGIAVRMRELRALFNDAITKGFVDEKHYPFKKYKISKLKSDPNKRALTKNEFNKFLQMDTNKHPHLAEAKRFFLFSYYTRGMNFHDMMKLKWDNVVDGRITYVRSKTKKRFSVKILKPVQDILKYYQSINSGTSYVFPILLREEMTPLQIEYRKAKQLKKFNSDLKRIAKVININKNITSYVARHSYATHLKNIGIQTDIIGESMGHSNVRVTMAYLKDFDSETIDKANERLLEEPVFQNAS